MGCIVSVVLSLGLDVGIQSDGALGLNRYIVFRIVVNDRLCHSPLLMNGCSDFPLNAAPVEPQRATALYP